MKQGHKQLLAQLADYDNYGGDTVSKGAEIESREFAGNPKFQSQFNLTVSNVYYDVTNSNVILAAALPAGLQVDNPAYIFGNSDYAGAYKRSKQVVPFVNGGAGSWNFVEAGILGSAFLGTPKDNFPTGIEGDMIFVSEAVSGGVTYRRIVIVHCPQVSYGSLLDAIQSDTFTLNLIRYTVDPTLTNQLTKQLSIIRQTMFGKFTTDTIDPQLYITGGTYNRNISDMAVSIPVDKNLILGTQILYNVPTINLMITVSHSNRLTASL